MVCFPLATLLEAIRNLITVRYQHEPNSKAEQVDIDRYQIPMNKLRKRFAEALMNDQDWAASSARVDE